MFGVAQPSNKPVVKAPVGVSPNAASHNDRNAAERLQYDFRAATNLRYLPPRDILTRALALASDLSRHRPNADQWYRKGKRLWLAGGLFDEKKLNGYYEQLWKLEYGQPEEISYYPAYKDDKSVSRQIIRSHAAFSSKASETPVEAHWSKINENVYGRKFESDVARSLIEEPLSEMLEAIGAMGTALMGDIKKALGGGDADSREGRFIKRLSDKVAADRRPWFDRTALIDEFVAVPSMESLNNVLTSSRNGFEMMAVINLISKFSEVINEIDEDIAPFWNKASNHVYFDVIKRNRSTAEEISASTEPPAESGILMPHHPGYRAAAAHGGSSMRNCTTAKALLPQLQPFGKAALRGGYSIVCGLSGSANLASFLIHDLAVRDPTFNSRAAMLGVLAFLTFDGGHSFNEGMAVFHASRGLPNQALARLEPNQWKPKWSRDLLSYRFGYDALAELPTSDESRAKIANLLDAVLDDIVGYFKLYDVNQAGNQIALEKIAKGILALPTELPDDSGDESSDGE